MQYAYMKLGHDRFVLMDAGELVFMNQIMEAESPALAAQESDITASDNDADYRFALVYGCYMPQANCNFPTREKIRHIKDAVGYALVSVQNAKVKYLSIEAVSVFDNPLLTSCGHRGHGVNLSENVAFAALVQIPKDMVIGTKSTQAVSAFLRYKQQMDLPANVLNRMGLFALKAEEKRLPKGLQLTKDNWTQFIDQKRALETARAVR